MKDLIMNLFVTFLLFVAMYTTYIFYFGSCELVKHYWYIVQVPGRCI